MTEEKTEWTDESRKEAVEAYTSMEPTSENTQACVADVAEQIGKSPNSIRMILMNAGVYVKQTPAEAVAAKKTTRVSKADAHARLAAAIAATGRDPSMDAITKLTGKNAIYFAEIYEELNG